MITSEIIADSLNKTTGDRLTSWVLKYPRFFHSELMTHRMFSKNSASSRAIPIDKMIKIVEDEPAMPEFWGKNQKGMQAVEEMDDTIESELYYYREYLGGGAEDVRQERITPKEKAKRLWLQARNSAIENAKYLNQMGLHKQIVNRVLEPFAHMTVIFSGTEHGNFFALRAHKDAQPEFRILAEQMLEKYNTNIPKILKPGDWHIPFGDKIDDQRICPLVHQLSESRGNIRGAWDGFKKATEDLKIKIAIARCARVSYLNFEGKDDYKADIDLCDRLFGSVPRHLSPTEHVAQAIDKSEFIGNFKGWKQYRKFFTDENLKDERIKI